MAPAVKRYRKKPVVIEGMQFDGSVNTGTAIVDWITESGEKASYHKHLMDGDLIAHPDPYLLIETLEGRMTASVGDWIIKGVNGEFYPCKPEIFEKTYEVVE